MYYNARAYIRNPVGTAHAPIFWFDLTRDQMDSQLAAPFRNGRPIVKGGRVWPIHEVKAILISRTDRTSGDLRAAYQKGKADGTITGIAEEAYIMREGEDVTEEMIREPDRVTTLDTDSIVDRIGIRESLARFRAEWPDSNKVAFVMMRFGTTQAHTRIVEAIVAGLSAHGITGLRADSKQYHDGLLQNVLTYAHGCGFGVAVFERIEREDFNPNISLEVGYMLALGRPVCFLKDQTLKALHTDLIGRLYKQFDPQDPLGSIPSEVGKWLGDKTIIPLAEE